MSDHMPQAACTCHPFPNHGKVVAHSNGRQSSRRYQPTNSTKMIAARTTEFEFQLQIVWRCLTFFKGYYSWRNSIRGSWFIQSLYTVFKSEKHTTDVLRLLTRVNRMVAYEFESNASSMAMNHKKQVPYIASTLTKDLYLQSKIRWANTSMVFGLDSLSKTKTTMFHVVTINLINNNAFLTKTNNGQLHHIIL